MKRFFTRCLFPFVFGQAAFAIMDAPPPEDTVRDAKTGTLYRVFVDEVSAIRENLSDKSQDSSRRGFDFKAFVTYDIAPEGESVFKKRDNGEGIKDCPDGWQNRDPYLNCTLTFPLSPPLTFVLDTGENRKRHFSKAEQDSAWISCKHCQTCHNYNLGSAYFNGIRSVCDFVYLDKAGKPHEVTFARQYDSDRGRFVSLLFYRVYEETCDSGWIRWNWYWWRKESRYRECAKEAFDSTGWEEASKFRETSPIQAPSSFDWKSLNDTGENCEKDLSKLPENMKDRCYYVIPDPPLFSPKKKPAKRPGKAR